MIEPREKTVHELLEGATLESFFYIEDSPVIKAADMILAAEIESAKAARDNPDSSEARRLYSIGLIAGIERQRSALLVVKMHLEYREQQRDWQAKEQVDPLVQYLSDQKERI